MPYIHIPLPDGTGISVPGPSCRTTGESATVFVPGLPKSMPRPRLGKGRVYVPHTADEWKNEITAAMKHIGPWEGPIAVTIIFLMPRPKRIELGRLEAHAVRPDIDNLVKTVLDGMTYAGVWHDDRQVFSLTAEKFYAPTAFTGCAIIVRQQYGNFDGGSFGENEGQAGPEGQGWSRRDHDQGAGVLPQEGCEGVPRSILRETQEGDTEAGR
jgi:Holliday junction resolvase RusA-like endonuclease